MKKNRTSPVGWGRKVTLNLFRKMKLTLLFSLVFIFQLSASNSMAQKRVTLNLKDATLEQFFSEIRKQTGDIIMYSNSEVDVLQKISVKVDREELPDLLDRVLSSLQLGYKQVKDYIVVHRLTVQQAERRIVKGKITDERGQPMPGVTIVVKGTSTGVSSDNNGEYTITTTGELNTLIISFIGYKTVEIGVNNREVVDVRLEPEDTEISEVVVTGYFTRATESFTGSVKTLAREELLRANPTNILSALAVLEPSFKMVENIADGSNPNVIPEFQIRGSSSLPNMKGEYQGSPNMPIFIMDGFEISVEKVFDMDPQRIESLTLLKDAAATSMYGSRASNGVVVITTRLPAAGKVNFTYNLDLGLTFPDLTDYDLLNAREKVDLEIATGYYEPTGNPYTDEQIRDRFSQRKEWLARGNNTYWLNKPLRNALTHKHAFNVEGGEGSIRFSLDVGLEKNPGVMKKSGRDRKSLGVTLQYALGDKLVFRNQTTYADIESTESPYGSFSTYARLNPYYPIYDEYGRYLFWLDKDRTILNPLFNTALNTFEKTRYNEWLNNFSINWWMNDRMQLKGTFSLSYQDRQGEVFKPGNHTDFYNYDEENIHRAGIYNATDGRRFNYDASLVFSYNQTFHQHFVNANAVVQMTEANTDSYTLFLEGFPDDNLDYLAYALQYSEENPVVATDDKSRLIGFVGSANYSYGDRYLVDLSLRVDASSKFGADNRWAPFWSVGLGWNLHHEQFVKKIEWINRLKLRASYGYTGSQNFSPYQSMTMYQYNMTRRYNYAVGATMIGLGNDELKWQTAIKTNVGIELGILKDYVNLTFEWYNEKTENLLTDVTLPSSLGFDSYRSNLGDVRNRGWELSSRVTLWRRDDGYVNVALGLTRNRNKLLKLSEALAAWNAVGDAEEDSDKKTNRPRVRYVEGESLKTIWGVKSMGINPTTGDEIFVSREGELTDKWQSKDQIPIGVDEPDLEGNLGINAAWKGIQLSAYFAYRVGGQTYNQTLVDRVENVWNWENTDRRVLNERWQKPGDIVHFKKFEQTRTLTQSTSRFVSDYDYLKLSSLSVSYDFDREIARKLWMQSLRFSVSMNDVFRVSNVKEERGISYPFARTVRMSLRAIF